MEDHFKRLLDVGSSTSANASSTEFFLASKQFAGSKVGFVFRNGDQGLGYYFDPFQGVELSSFANDKKRKYDNLGEKEIDLKGIKVESSDIDKLLEEAENSGITSLDQTSLKQLLLNLERKINKNQMMRMKYGDQPQKFMESEIDLNAEINELYPLAASPELYSTFVQSGSLVSVLGMITHENTDISLSTIGLLQELTDPATLVEEDAMVLVDAFIEAQGLELIVQNLSRLIMHEFTIHTPPMNSAFSQIN